MGAGSDESGNAFQMDPSAVHEASPPPGAEGDVDRLVRARFFPEETDGVMVEVGAARPDFLSLSASFRRLGWTVVSVEPNPEFCALHRAHGHEVLQYACGDHDEDGVDFCVVDSGGMPHSGGAVSYESFSSLAIKDSYAALAHSDLDVRKIKVDLRRLDTILREHAPSVERIDLLAVDVEGWELEVLGGLDFDTFRPRVIIVENLLRLHSYRDYMKSKGYRLWRGLVPNEVYARGSEITLRDRAAQAAWLVRTRGGGLLDSLRARVNPEARPTAS